MKKINYLVLIVTALVVIGGCNLFGNKSLNGKWEHTNSTASESFILELSSDTWTYYKNDKVLEKGLLEINGDQLTMGHEIDGAADHAPHAYTWTLSADTLSLILDNTKSVFIKK